VAAEGLVYPGFRPEQVCEVDCRGWAAALAVDFGLRDPSVILTIRYGSGRYHVEREYYREGASASDLVTAAKAEYDRSGADVLIYDPAGAQIAADFVSADITMQKADNAIVSGIKRVSSVLPMLTVDPSCPHTIGEFDAYAYPKNATARDLPAPGNDHAMDALRYAVMALVDGGDFASW
jgi:phage terminase large subunit